MPVIKKYIGCKIIAATPMTFNEFQTMKSKEYIDKFIHGKRYGKIRGVTVEIKKLIDLKATKTLLEIKERVK